uniref:Uncharacterized protein n=1 Tax=Rhizophora mucronata TaxID=61149 RepID=A0A2P2PD75_RHIMU
MFGFSSVSSNISLKNIFLRDCCFIQFPSSS